jgi:hypothetical protein
VYALAGVFIDNRLERLPRRVAFARFEQVHALVVELHGGRLTVLREAGRDERPLQIARRKAPRTARGPRFSEHESPYSPIMPRQFAGTK